MAKLSQQTRRNFRDTARKIERLAQEMEDVTGEYVRDIGEEIMTDVKASRPGKGVPKDIGTLQGSGTVEGPDARNLVLLAFGGPAAPYAVTQHERMDFRHKLGEARYLVRGMERWEPGGSQARKAVKEATTAAIQKARAS